MGLKRFMAEKTRQPRDVNRIPDERRGLLLWRAAAAAAAASEQQASRRGRALLNAPRRRRRQAKDLCVAVPRRKHVRRSFTPSFRRRA